MTRVCLVDCEVMGAEQEAIHVWRGAELEMSRCRVHHCGQGVTVTRCNDPEFELKLPGLQQARSKELLIADSLFEDIADHDWSSALSIGNLVSCSREPQDVPMRSTGPDSTVSAHAN